MKDNFSTFDVLKIFKISRPRLREWMVRGFIKPTIPANGQGTKALFTKEDIYKIALFIRLIKVGFKRKQASELCCNIDFKLGVWADENLLQNDLRNSVDKKIEETQWSKNNQISSSG
jgi:DNA-binding transcriptional MerR regulator